MLKYLLLCSLLMAWSIQGMQNEADAQESTLARLELLEYRQVTKIGFARFLGSIAMTTKAYPGKEDTIVITYLEPESSFFLGQSKTKNAPGFLKLAVICEAPVALTIYSAGKPLEVFYDGKKIEAAKLLTER